MFSCFFDAKMYNGKCITFYTFFSVVLKRWFLTGSLQKRDKTAIFYIFLENGKSFIVINVCKFFSDHLSSYPTLFFDFREMKLKNKWSQGNLWRYSMNATQPWCAFAVRCRDLAGLPWYGCTCSLRCNNVTIICTTVALHKITQTVEW